MAIDWSHLRGLLTDLGPKLSTPARTIFENEIYAFSKYERPVHVSNAGKEILSNLEDESYNHGTFRKDFQNGLVNYLETAIRGEPYEIQCCRYHIDINLSIRGQIELGHSGWLERLIEILAVSARKLVTQCPSNSPVDESEILFRVMPLSLFMSTHVRSGDSAKSSAAARKHLVHLRPASRRLESFLDRRSLGTPVGRIGSYPSKVTATASYNEWCDKLRSFASLARVADADVDHEPAGAPDKVLLKMGIPFDRGEEWIELRYPAYKSKIDYPTRQDPHLAVPLVPDSKGRWMFRPDRDDPADWGFARDLEINNRGFPEVLHEPLEVWSLQDLFIFGLPTEKPWSEYATWI